ncbi:MAG: M16 family metallopeptidase [Sphingomicrobium sp.]
MRSHFIALLAATALSVPALAATAPSAPVSTLVRQVAIPHSTFRLPNGLTVIVHEDHKAPVVAVSTWYNVGSKDEPATKTGFAHLYEHLMFNGSEDLPGDYFTYLQQVGATDYNGTTSYDRTNYFETVPAGALERALFMESDRMGHLLGAVTQGVLDNQRGVVQNEKRQNDSRPGGLTQYALFGTLFPEGHPYHHTVIGSMEDLDAASLADVKQWFRNRYGPNNAVLVIAGDTTLAKARPLVERYFGDIARGPVNRPAQAVVPTLASAKAIAMKDNVATEIVSRSWAVPGLLDPQMASLDVGVSILGGLSSSRFDKVLVREEKVAVNASASYNALQRVGIVSLQAFAKPGASSAALSQRMDAILAELIAQGPTKDEVQRAVTSEVAQRIRGLEQVGGFGGKAVSLAEGQTYAANSDFYKKTLAAYAAVTPASVRAAMQRWLTRPALTITLSPGKREAYAEAKSVAVAKPTAPKVDASIPKPTRTPPAVGQLAGLQWPTITHTTLANGIAVIYAQRTTVPLTQLALSFDAGNAADPVNSRGLAAMTVGLLEEGTTSLNSQQVAEAEERLGAEISAGNSLDRSTVSLSALTPNLAPSLDLLADIVQRPAFASAEVDRIRVKALTGIAQTQRDPTRVAQRVLPAAIYGSSHPYGGPAGGDPAAMAKLSRADLVGFQQSWLRPDTAKIFIVSDRPLAELKPMLEARLGQWVAPAASKGVKNFAAPQPRPPASRILLVDRPGAPQASIVGGQLLPVSPRSDTVPLTTANEVLGGNFLSRLNMDIRESKGWSYGVNGSANINANAVAYTVSAPVQMDRTGDALTTINSDIGDFLGSKGINDEELQRTVANSVNELPGQFETSSALLGAMMRNDLLGRPDNYYATLPARYRAQTAASLDQAIRGAVAPQGFTWVVVGDAAKIRPQLEKTGLPIEVVEAK